MLIFSKIQALLGRTSIGCFNVDIHLIAAGRGGRIYIMIPKNLQTKLYDLLCVRDAVIQCSTLDDVVNKTIEITLERLSAQTASVFLYSKEGKLRRICIGGYDKFGGVISNDWFYDEAYNIGESLTGKVIVPTSNSNYGQPIWFNSLANADIHEKSKARYIDKLGCLKCGIAVPLNGHHRTYGVLEVINKFDVKQSKVQNKTYSKDDIYWLPIIAMNLATAISHLRRQNELSMLAELSEYLIDPFEEDTNPIDIYCRMAKTIVSPLTSYKACIIRILKDNNELEIVAREGDNISWEHWIDFPLRNGERIAGKVFQTGNPEFIVNLDELNDEFVNIDWAKHNGLKSCAFAPLRVRDRIVGTLSIYVGHSFYFFENEKKFIQNVSFLIAAFTQSFGMVSEYNETDMCKSELHSEARAISYDSSVQKSLHTYKHELVNIKKELEASLVTGPGKRNDIIRQQLEFLEERIKRINMEFKQSALTVININNIIKALLRSLSKEIKKDHIGVTYNFSTLPTLELSEKDFQEVFYNILSNAIKAVSKNRRSDREICIATEIVDENQIEYVKVTITDNGVGIPNEIASRIYDRNFTEFPGGTGMGLFLTREILDSFGCKYRFDSVVGKGTKFYILIPIRRYKVGDN